MKIISSLLIALFFSLIINGQEDKTVTLSISGQGKTQDEAKQNALRNAIEQAFGVFISSNTEILNDELVKDEIVSVSNGNIQKFEVISEVQIPDGGFATTLNATVSVNKLTSFVESKGYEVEFKGSLFASNIGLQNLMEKNEVEAIKNMVPVLKSFSEKSFEYVLQTSEPKMNPTDKSEWLIGVSVGVKVNKNFMQIPKILQETVSNLSLEEHDLENYTSLNKSVYPITIATKSIQKTYHLRSEESIATILDFVYSMNNDIVNFQMSNGLDNFTLHDIKELSLYDYPFRLILKKGNGGGSCGINPASLFHNFFGSRHDNDKPIFNYKTLVGWPSQYYIEYGQQKEYNCFYFSPMRKWEYKQNRLLDKPLNGLSLFFNFYQFKDLHKLMLPKKLSKYREVNLGLMISFQNIEVDTYYLNFQFIDKRSMDEIKKISKYEIIN